MNQVINCPNCRMKITTVNPKRQKDLHTECVYCHKKIIYHIDTKTIETVRNAPVRNTSSGVRFN